MLVWRSVTCSTSPLSQPGTFKDVQTHLRCPPLHPHPGPSAPPADLHWERCQLIELRGRPRTHSPCSLCSAHSLVVVCWASWGTSPWRSLTTASTRARSGHPADVLATDSCGRIDHQCRPPVCRSIGSCKPSADTAADGGPGLPLAIGMDEAVVMDESVAQGGAVGAGLRDMDRNVFNKPLQA
jgi:hypothetical protein